MKGTVTSWTVAGLGALVTTAGAALMKRKSKLGASIFGFGLAHVVLGLLDRMRPSVRY